MRLRTLLDTEALGLRLLDGAAELNRTVSGVITTELKSPGRRLSGGELVLTELAWRQAPEDSEPFIQMLADAGVAALAVTAARPGAIPQDVVVACARHRLPLFAVGESVALSMITEHVVRQVAIAAGAVRPSPAAQTPGPFPAAAAPSTEFTASRVLLPFVPDEVRESFTAQLLDPLRAYDRRHRAQLVLTLEAFLACDGSWARCAARLHLHVNTLRYRVGRIEQLTERDLSRLTDKVDFLLALRMS